MKADCANGLVDHFFLMRVSAQNICRDTQTIRLALVQHTKISCPETSTDDYQSLIRDAS